MQRAPECLGFEMLKYIKSSYKIDGSLSKQSLQWFVRVANVEPSKNTFLNELANKLCANIASARVTNPPRELSIAETDFEDRHSCDARNTAVPQLFGKIDGR